MPVIDCHTPLRVRVEGIPDQLKTLPCWCLWKFVPGESGKPKKIPFRSVDGDAARTNTRHDFGAFEDALERYLSGEYTGIGFAIFPEYRIVGIDHDDCVDPNTHEMQAWAGAELLGVPTYAEYSPSGTGFKQLGFGELPEHARSTKPGSQTEMYDGKPGRERFFTITGHRIELTSPRIEEVSQPIRDAYDRMLAFDLVEAFRRRGMLKDGTTGTSNKQLVKCPWAQQHSHGDDEAALFRNRGRKGGYSFKCLHAHCQHRTVADVYAYFGFAEARADDDRPTILIGGDLHLKTEEVWSTLSALNEASPDPVIYRFGNAFGRITHLTVDDQPAIELLSNDKLKQLLAAHIRFQDVQKIGLVPVHPPNAIVTNLLATGDPPELPRIRRLVSAPVFAKDGSLLTTPGFHPGAEVYYAPPNGFVLPGVSPHPSADELKEAKRWLLEELLVDFPFVDRKADRAHAVALLLLLFARDFIDGDLPLHLIEKPEVGTGAGKLADACLIPAIGGRQGIITDCNDEDEWRKRITATLLGAPEAVLLDNVTKLASHQLAALFTTGKWKDRVLGMSRIVELKADMPWIATGNNPEIGYDLVRRICAIRLDAKMPDPTARSAFKHELPTWALEHRASLVWAALTLIQHWVAEGQPPWAGPLVASFERWSAVMGGILKCAGIEGFGTNSATFRLERNIQANAWRALVQAWWTRCGSRTTVGTSTLWPLVQELDIVGDLGLHDARDMRSVFGLALRRQRGRQFRWVDDNKQVIEVRIETPEEGTTRCPYRLEQVNKDKLF